MIVDVETAEFEMWKHYFLAPEIHPVIRSKRLAQMMARPECNTQRKLATHLGIKKSRLHDWLLFKDMTVQEYNNKLNDGSTITEIYHERRIGKARSQYFLHKIGAFTKELRTWQRSQEFRSVDFEALQILEDVITDIVFKHNREGKKESDREMCEVQ